MSLWTDHGNPIIKKKKTDGKIGYSRNSSEKKKSFSKPTEYEVLLC